MGIELGTSGTVARNCDQATEAVRQRRTVIGYVCTTTVTK
jgi:hypothetical protein